MKAVCLEGNSPIEVLNGIGAYLKEYNITSTSYLRVEDLNFKGGIDTDTNGLYWVLFTHEEL